MVSFGHTFNRPAAWIALTAAAFVSLSLATIGKSPFFGIFLVMGVAGAASIARWPAVGIAFLTFLLPLERIQRFTDDNETFTISIMRIVAIGTLGSLLLHRALRKQPIFVDPSMAVYGGYALIAALGLASSTDPGGTKRALGTIGANLIFFFLYLNYFRTRQQIRTMLYIWLAANVLAIFYSTYDWHLGSGRTGGIQMEVDPGQGVQMAVNRWSTVWQDRAEWETLGGSALRRSMGPTSHAAVYGINLVLTIPFFILLLKRSAGRVWQSAGLLVVLALLAYNILLTNTRAVMLQAGIAGVLCLGFGLFKLRTVHILVGVLVFAIGIAAMPKDIFNRVLDPNNYKTEKSAAMRVRLEYWKAGMEIVKDKWLLGMGVGNENEVPKHVKGTLTADKSTVHNTYLQFLLEVGVFGWILFYSFVGLMFFYARRAAGYLRTVPGWEYESDLLDAAQVAMLCVAIFGVQVDVYLFPLKGWWLLLLITLVLYRWSETLRCERRVLEQTARDCTPQLTPFLPTPAP